MTNEQFVALAKLMRMRLGKSNPVANAARMVLVERRTPIAAAHSNGIPTTSLHNCLMRCRRAYAQVLTAAGIITEGDAMQCSE